MKRVIASLIGELKGLTYLSAHKVVHALSSLIPRSEKRWVFGHLDGHFLGNPRGLFLWMSIYRPDIQITWLTDDKATETFLRRHGYRACAQLSLMGLIAILRSKVVIYAHGPRTVNFSLTGGAYFANLWHGVGLKGVKYGYESKGGGRSGGKRQHKGALHRWNYLTYLFSPDILATTSDFMQRHFASQFRLPEERCPQLGYPRLDCAFDTTLYDISTKLDADTGFQLNPDSAAELYVYMPTFRDTKRPFVDEALPDFAKLSAALKARNGLLYVKLHPYTKANIKWDFDNIREWPDQIDIHTYLGAFAGLITDYSSILYDFICVKDRGAIVYDFDYEEYTSKDRSLLYPFDENICGARASNFDRLCEVIETGEAMGDALVPQTLALRDKFWGGSGRPASPKVVDYVLADLTNS